MKKNRNLFLLVLALLSTSSLSAVELVGRGQAAYANDYGTLYIQDLLRLNSKNLILDGGSGPAIALKNYRSTLDKKDLTQGPRVDNRWESLSQEEAALLLSLFKVQLAQRAQTIGIEKHPDRIWEEAEKAGVKFITEYVEDIPIDQISDVDIITDYIGAFSYTDRLDEVINHYLSWIKMDGTIYVRYGPDRVKIKTLSGELLSIKQWLRTHKNIKMFGSGKTLVLQKLEKNAQVRRLRLLDKQSGLRKTFEEF